MPGPLAALVLFAAGAACGALLSNRRVNHAPRAMERHLREALTRNRFMLEYQPIVRLDTGRCYGAEALLRWRDRNGQLIYPDTFMALAVETGFAEPLTYRVIELLARDMIPLLRERPAFHVSVNIPPNLLGEGKVALTAERRGLLAHAGQIIIEITETSIVDNVSRQAITLARALNARVAIDDFGTGTNELAQLQDLEIDFIKIDKSFVGRIGSHQQATKFVEWIVALTHDIGAQAIAEGVETDDQATYLRGLGVEMAQGYLYAKPLSIGDLKQYLEAEPIACGK